MWKLTSALVPLLVAGLLLTACTTPETDDEGALESPASSPSATPTPGSVPTPSATPVTPEPGTGVDGDLIANTTLAQLTFHTDYILLMNTDGQQFYGLPFGATALDASQTLAEYLGVTPTTVTVPEGEYLQGYSHRPGYGFPGFTIFPEFSESGFHGRRYQVVITAATSNGVALITGDGLQVGKPIAPAAALYPLSEPWINEDGEYQIVIDPKHQDYNWTYLYAADGTNISRIVLPTGA
jgi:hypothetical protein